MAEPLQGMASHLNTVDVHSSNGTSKIRDDVMNLKEDIINEILTHLPSSDLAICMRLNHFWYSQASRHLYRKVTLDQDTMPSFFRGLGSIYDDIGPCGATMAGGIWKDCEHETAARLDIPSRPRTQYNFKAPLLRYVQTLTVTSHHRCMCAPAGPLIHRLLSNLKMLRIVRSVCGCPSSCAVNALCDSASCPFLTCFADKYVFRNNDGDCATAASSRMERHGYLFNVEGRENRTTVVLPRTLGLLHNHAAVEIAFRSSLERATSIKLVFADWEGCSSRTNAISITLKDAQIIIRTIGDLLEGAPKCREVFICGLERVELAATRGGKASRIDEDDLRTLKKQIVDHISRSVWVRRSLPDSMFHPHNPHPGDFLHSFNSAPHPAGGGNNDGVNSNSAPQHSADDIDDDAPALPGVNVPDVSSLFGDSNDESETDGASDDDDDDDDAQSSLEYETVSDPNSEDSDLENDESSNHSPATEGNHGSHDYTNGTEPLPEGLSAMTQAMNNLESAGDLLAALASGWSLLGSPPSALGSSALPTSANNASAPTTQSSTAMGGNNPTVPQVGGTSHVNTSGAAPGAPGQSSDPLTGIAGVHYHSLSLLAAFQEIVASISHAEREEGHIFFKTFEQYIADEDSRGELSLQ